MPSFSRRAALSNGIALSSLGLLPTGAGAHSSQASSQVLPNIIWIVCHDIHAPLLGCYGNEQAVTPAIDGLARRGIRFDKAYATTPVCSPSRFSLMTGIYPQSWGPAENMRSVAQVADQTHALPQYLRQSGYYCTNNVFTDYNCDFDPRAIWNECSITAHWRRRPAGKPFFCVYNYLITHESHIFETTPVETDPAKVALPPYLPDTPDMRDAFARNIDMVNRQDKAVAHILQELEQDGLTGETVIFFLADHGGVTPRTKRYCYEGGLHVPLIVAFPEKYRALAQRPLGTPSADLVSLVDLAPTTLALAGHAVPEIMQGQAFFGRSPEPARSYVFSGRNRMDECYDLMRTVTDGRYRYIRNYMPHRIYGQHNSYEWLGRGYQSWEEEWRSGRLNDVQSAFWRPKPSEELYDLAADPHQIRNLAQSGAAHVKLGELRSALDTHILKTWDNGFFPETAGHQGYFSSRKPGAYPLPALLDLTARAIARDRADIPRFTRELTHENEAMRYWAATGLLIVVDSLDSRAVDDIAARFEAEQAASVRAVLGEILLDRHLGRKVLPWLAETIRNLADSTASLASLTVATWAPRSEAIALTPAVADVTATKAQPRTPAGVLMLFSAASSATYLRAVLAGTYNPRKPPPGPDMAALLHSPAGQAMMKAMGGRLGDPQI